MEQRGCTLRVLNEGHHWLFQKPGFVAEWWSSSAKRVLNRDDLRDYHAPHWADVTAALQRHQRGDNISKLADHVVRAQTRD